MKLQTAELIEFGCDQGRERGVPARTNFACAGEGLEPLTLNFVWLGVGPNSLMLKYFSVPTQPCGWIRRIAPSPRRTGPCGAAWGGRRGWCRSATGTPSTAADPLRRGRRGRAQGRGIRMWQSRNMFEMERFTGTPIC